MSGKTDLPMGWALWLGWVLANIAGAVAGFPLAMAAMWVITAMGIVDERAIFPYVLFPMVGVCIGGMQWLILRRYTLGADIWVLATAAAWPLCYAFIGLAIRGAIGIGDIPFAGAITWAITFALIGAALGGIQWLVLRRHFSRAGRWVLASAAGFAIFAAFGSQIDILALIALLGAIPGATTGAALVWLLRQSSYTEQAI